MISNACGYYDFDAKPLVLKDDSSLFESHSMDEVHDFHTKVSKYHTVFMGAENKLFQNETMDLFSLPLGFAKGRRMMYWVSYNKACDMAVSRTSDVNSEIYPLPDDIHIRQRRRRSVRRRS